MAEFSLSFPKDLLMKIRRISAMTGTSETALRDACRAGDLAYEMRSGAYYSTLNDHDAWVKQGKGRGDVREASERPVAMPNPSEREADQRNGDADPSGRGKVGARGGRKGKERRCRPGQRVVVEDIRPLLG